jgi:hypothetical protein
LRIYLDACCLSRLTDDQSQARVHAVSDAIEHILRMVRAGLATWVSSTILNVEVSRNPDPDRRHDAEEVLSFANEVVVPQSAEAARPVDELNVPPQIQTAHPPHLACP